ncbi:hypothetical protein ACRAKI_16285 [Saccharothrix isguenensis]
MTFRARPATVGLLTFAFLVAGCTGTPEPTTTATTTEPSATSVAPSTWGPAPATTERARPEELNAAAPKRFTDGDVCELLTSQEITATAQVSSAEDLVTDPGKRCSWQLGDSVDAKGMPAEFLIIQVHLADMWQGTEQGVINGHPTRRRSQEGLCVLRIALRKPADQHTDQPVMAVSLKRTAEQADVCPAAQSLAALVLDRLPAA